MRTDIRRERVYLYETIATPWLARELLLKISQDINSVYDRPRMYNILFNNCTNALTRRVEDVSDVNFPLTWKVVLPGYFDEVLYDMGLIVSDDDFLQTKQRALIDNSSVYRRDPDYEFLLRQ